MLCHLRKRLEKEHTDAGAAFDIARGQLRGRIGISTKDEYEDLNRRADKTWTLLNDASERLDGHIRDHGCEA